MPESEAFIDYLVSKISVEDRALNGRVWRRLLAWAEGRGSPLNVFEPGAGIGSMLIRLLSAGALGEGRYTALDPNAACLDYAKSRLLHWGAENHIPVHRVTNDIISLELGRGSVRVEFIQNEIQPFLDHLPAHQKWDLLIAHALLDLLDVQTILPAIFDRLGPTGGFYFPICFDGVTIFEPTIAPALDDRIIRCYHDTMDGRIIKGKRSGESRTGRRLLGAIEPAGGRVREAGSSDWIVYPTDRSYPYEESKFLSYILDMIEDALGSHPDLQSGDLAYWIARRRSQLEAGELIFIAHQLDIFGVR